MGAPALRDDRWRDIVSVFDREQQANRGADRRARLASLVRDFVDRLSFALDIPGQHYGGLSNQELFDILAAQGRDFGARSRELDEHLRIELTREFADYISVPSDALFRQIVGDIILEWVVSRMEGERHDVPIRPLDPRTVEFKRKNGFDARVGIMRGDLLEAVKSAGVVVR